MYNIVEQALASNERSIEVVITSALPDHEEFKTFSLSVQLVTSMAEFSIRIQAKSSIMLTPAVCLHPA